MWLLVIAGRGNILAAREEQAIETLYKDFEHTEIM
jgi:hypothetical protein